MQKISYLGIPGSFFYEAANKYFGQEEQYVEATNFREIFEQLNTYKTNSAILAIENSLAGSIAQNYDFLYQYSVEIIGEIYLPINQCLLGLTDDVKQLKKVLSHPMALAQCEKFFKMHPELERAEFLSTADAARFVQQNQDTSIAAIAGSQCAELYNLEIIQTNIQDDPNNWTRFVAIKLNESDTILSLDSNKASLAFTLDHVPGSLHSFLDLFAGQGINLTKIESRPIQHKPFEYIFYVDFEFEQADLSKTLELVHKAFKFTKNHKILGIYKSSRPVN